MRHTQRLIAALFLATSACNHAPAAPSSTSLVPAVTTPSALVLFARPSAPATGTLLPFASQPVSLLVTLDFTPSAPDTATVLEVATDDAFKNVIETEPIPLVKTPTTTISLKPLAASTIYFWRTRASAGTASWASVARSFVMGSSQLLQKPVPEPERIKPTPTYTHPLLSAIESTLAGDPRKISYRFEVAQTSSFLPIVSSGFGQTTGGDTRTLVQENTWTVVDELELSTTYYWRVVAIDSATNAAVYSDVATFTTLPPTSSGKPALHVSSNCTGWSGAYPFDGLAAVVGDRIHFVADKGGYNANQLTLDLQIVNGSVTGTLGGLAVDRFGTRQIQAWIGPQSLRVAAPIVGVVAADGLLTGQVNGQVGFWTTFGDGGGCANAAGAKNSWALYLK